MLGFGTKDEGADVLAALLIESGQEIVTRLNRDHFHAPPHPSIAEAVQRVTSSGVEDAEQDVLRIGLSGRRRACPGAPRKGDQAHRAPTGKPASSSQ